MVELLFAIGIAVAVFVGINIGGSSTGAAFGPIIGSKVISKRGAAALMTLFLFLGGITIGRRVVDTLGGHIVPSGVFTPWVSISILFFIGAALLIGNMVGVPASTSMTAVGAIGGLGLATGTLEWSVMGRIIGWWIASPLIAFLVSGFIGRYLYPHLVARFDLSPSPGNLLVLDRSRTLPRPRLGPDTTVKEATGTVLLIGVGCYTAFSAGASNVANAIAPLVGSDALSMNAGIVLAGLAMGAGAFTLGKKTMDTVGNDLTKLPLLAALVVSLVSATIVTFLSWIGVPATFVVIATMSIVGLGWGRSTRTSRVKDTVSGKKPKVSVGALAAEKEKAPTVGDAEKSPSPETPPIGTEDPEELPTRKELFHPWTSARVLLIQNLVPALATASSFLLFYLLPGLA